MFPFFSSAVKAGQVLVAKVGRGQEFFFERHVVLNLTRCNVDQQVLLRGSLEHVLLRIHVIDACVISLLRTAEDNFIQHNFIPKKTVASKFPQQFHSMTSPPQRQSHLKLFHRKQTNSSTRVLFSGRGGVAGVGVPFANKF